MSVTKTVVSDAVRSPTARQEREDVTVRFAGDSGDGVQVTGNQFTAENAVAGRDLATFPDFPAEIRAPAGTTFGVSAFQIHFGSSSIRTEGDDVDILIAFNPAALKTNLSTLRADGFLIVNIGEFNDRNLKKAGYAVSPLGDGSLQKYTVLAVDIDKLTLEAVAGTGVGNKDAHRCKNFWALGLVLWLCDLHPTTTMAWLDKRFAAQPAVLAANRSALNAGHLYGEIAELGHRYPSYHVAPADYLPGRYRNISGTEALCWGLLTGARLAGLELTYCSYPITPASGMLHALAKLEQHGVTTFQAEDEIAAVCAAIGASYAGNLGITGTSGPGMALKTEALGLAIAAELPLIVVNAQRGGPSTGLPTKTEQSDLFQAVLGRNADTPTIVIAARSAPDCFDCAIEAVRLATKYMTPVILLTDGYLANAAEPWAIPDISKLAAFPVVHRTDPAGFQPFGRATDTLARDWVVPGTPGLVHRIGSLERADGSGNISYDPANHQLMTSLRLRKIAGVVQDVPDQRIDVGEDHGDLLVIGWGSTQGAIHTAVQDMRSHGHKVSSAHIRHLSPFPANLGALMDRFRTVLVPELNAGQLALLLRGTFERSVVSLSKVEGQPFKVREVHAAILQQLNSLNG